MVKKVLEVPFGCSGDPPVPIFTPVQPFDSHTDPRPDLVGAPGLTWLEKGQSEPGPSIALAATNIQRSPRRCHGHHPSGGARRSELRGACRARLRVGSRTSQFSTCVPERARVLWLARTCAPRTWVRARAYTSLLRHSVLLLVYNSGVFTGPPHVFIPADMYT